MLAKLDERLRDKDMGLELTQPAKDLLAKKGYDPVLGARPLRRTIQREIEDMLSEKILFGEVRPGQIVLVDTTGEGDEADVHLRGRGQGRAARRPACRDGHRPRRVARPTAVPRTPRRAPTTTVGALRTSRRHPPAVHRGVLVCDLSPRHAGPSDGVSGN